MKQYLPYETVSLIEAIERLIADKYYISSQFREGEEPITREQALWKLRKGGTIHKLVSIALDELVVNLLNSDEYLENEKLAKEKDQVMLPLYTQWHEDRVSKLYKIYSDKRKENEQSEISEALFIKSLKKNGAYYTMTADKMLGETK